MGVSSFLRLQPGLKLLKPFSGAAHVLITPNGDPIFAHRDAAPATINQCAYCIAEPPSRSSFLPLQPGLDQTADGHFSTVSSKLNAEPLGLLLNRTYRSPKNRRSFLQRG